eukprot:gb/GECG01014494.1/.p1 GENE.gb/GECG01014494.1/~~gb/GECG01014494.1/.p1  ORF type:complete len:221 (+),score=13.36 gb/GECG01014494.1/:1-663(+)
MSTRTCSTSYTPQICRRLACNKAKTSVRCPLVIHIHCSTHEGMIDEIQLTLKSTHVHKFGEEMAALLSRDTAVPEIIRTKLKYSGISTAMAANAATGAREISANLERAINRAAEVPMEQESIMQEVIRQLQENHCEFKEDSDLLIWASPKMMRACTEFEDPLHMDATHQVTVNGRDARLYVFDTFARDGEVAVIALGLGFNESSNTAMKALALVHNLLKK